MHLGDEALQPDSPSAPGPRLGSNFAEHILQSFQSDPCKCEHCIGHHPATSARVLALMKLQCRRYAQLATESAGDISAKMKRLSREVRDLQRGRAQLPLQPAASIFLRYDADRMDKIRACIVGGHAHRRARDAPCPPLVACFLEAAQRSTAQRAGFAGPVEHGIGLMASPFISRR